MRCSHIVIYTTSTVWFISLTKDFDIMSAGKYRTRIYWTEWIEHRRQELFTFVVVILFIGGLIGFNSLQDSQQEIQTTLKEVQTTLAEVNKTLDAIETRQEIWKPFKNFEQQTILGVTETIVTVRGEKCVDPLVQPPPVDSIGVVSIRSYDPFATVYIPMFSGTRTWNDEETCFVRVYENTLPVEEMRKHPEVALWQIIGVETPLDASGKQGVPETWETQPFIWPPA